MRRLMMLAAAAAFLLLPFSALAVTNPVVSIVAPTTAVNGETVDVQVVIDSDGVALAGYSFSVGFRVGATEVGLISSPSVATTLIAGGFIEDVFGTRNLCPGGVGCASDGFFNLNQSSFSGEALANMLTVETLTFTIEAANGTILEIEPFFQLGDALGLADGSCPPGPPGGEECTVTFEGATIMVGDVQVTPEPGLAILFGTASLGLLAARRRS